jgi:transcriptional regulator with XRE-family HTH domain
MAKAKSKFSTSYASLRRLLVTVRKGAGLTQVELAARLGTPQSYVSKVELGERRLDVVEFVDYVTALGGDPVRLLRTVMKGK